MFSFHRPLTFVRAFPRLCSSLEQYTMFRSWMFLLECCKFLFHVFVVCTWRSLYFLSCTFCFFCYRLCFLDCSCHATAKFLNLLQEPNGIVNRGQTRTPQLSAAVDCIAIAMKSLFDSVTMEAFTRTVTLSDLPELRAVTLPVIYNASLTTNRPSSAPLP